MTRPKPAIGATIGDLLPAILKNDLAAIRRLLQEGADVNAETATGNTLLHVAVRGRVVEIVGVLIERGAQVDARDKYGKTPLHCAARHGDLEVTKLLVDSGANINAMAHNGSFPLDWAIKFNHEALADVLRKHGGKNGKALK